MGDERTRRRILELAGVGAGLSLAGCVGGSDAAGGPTDGSPTALTTTTTRRETATDTRTNTRTPTETPQPSMSTVFHFSSGPGEQNHAVANVSNLLADDSVDVEDVVLVANGRGIELLTTDDSRHPGAVRDLVGKGVAFRACENSMAALDVEPDDLVEGVETVPSGVGELTKLQARDGYAYIETP